MSEKAYSLLRGYDYVHKEINIRVCAAFNDCVISTDSLTLDMHFNYNLTNMQTFKANLTFNVLNNIQYDLIIGRVAIRKYDIWQRTLPWDSTVNTLHNDCVASTLQNTNTLHKRVASSVVDKQYNTHNGLSVAHEGGTHNGLSVAHEGPDKAAAATEGKRKLRRIRTWSGVERPCRHVVHLISKDNTCESESSLPSTKKIRLLSRQQFEQKSSLRPLVGTDARATNSIIGASNRGSAPMQVEISSSDNLHQICDKTVLLREN